MVYEVCVAVKQTVVNCAAGRQTAVLAMWQWQSQRDSTIRRPDIRGSPVRSRPHSPFLCSKSSELSQCTKSVQLLFSSTTLRLKWGVALCTSCVVGKAWIWCGEQVHSVRGGMWVGEEDEEDGMWAGSWCGGGGVKGATWIDGTRWWGEKTEVWWENGVKAEHWRVDASVRFNEAEKLESWRKHVICK